jgi:GT2 family glycosyltransferase
VINHNGAHHLERTLEAVEIERRSTDEVILVDDASTDGSIELVNGLGNNVRIVELETNQGPGAARNAGFSAATHDLILFIDNDVSLMPRCTELLVSALEGRPAALTAVPRVVYSTDNTVVQYEGADCHFLGLMIPRLANVRAADCPAGGIILNNSIVTACFLIDRARWSSGELFDESFIFNYEDHDFGVRARVLGHQLLSVSKAQVIHGQGTAGMSYRPGSDYAPTRVYCLIRNRWQVILKSYSSRTLVVLLPIFLVYELFQLAGTIKSGWFSEWCRAVSWNLRHLVGILRLRRFVQRNRRTTDREILSGGELPFTEDVARSRTDHTVVALLNGVTGAYWAVARKFV